MGDQGLDDPVRVLVRHQPAGNLGVGFVGEDGLHTLALESSPDAVDFQGWPGPDSLERGVARLAKEIGKLDAELAKIAAKLANANFLAKAKPEVVEEQRERQVGAIRDRDRLRAAYDRLTVG